MERISQYLQYTGEILSGARPCPAGIALPEGEDALRAEALFRQVEAMGEDRFLAACAAQDGAPAPPPEDHRPQSQSAYEALLDCCALDEGLTAYLIDVLRRGDGLGFFRLAQVTTRTAMRPEAFLAWLATLEDRAGDEERACALLMDACFRRLLQDDQRLLLAALLSGDRTTFERFRCDAPELRQVPAATYEWYARNYLDRSYPFRVLLRANGVALPGAGTEGTDGPAAR